MTETTHSRGHDRDGAVQTEMLRRGAAPQRLRAALTIGTDADDEFLDVLIERCRLEPDFFVRDMLTWALTRLDPDLVVPSSSPSSTPTSRRRRARRCTRCRRSATDAAGKPSTRMSSDCGSSPIPTPRWPAVRGDPRCPWCRVRIERILHQLVTQLGRGDLETQKSLSRALVALGDDLVSVVDGSVGAEEETVRAHALATVEMFHDPDAGFAHAMGEAKRVVALGSEATA